jgi:hypothetical protein
MSCGKDGDVLRTGPARPRETGTSVVAVAPTKVAPPVALPVETGIQPNALMLRIVLSIAGLAVVTVLMALLGVFGIILAVATGTAAYFMFDYKAALPPAGQR